MVRAIEQDDGMLIVGDTIQGRLNHFALRFRLYLKAI